MYMYDSLAPVYDILNREIDYEAWAEYLTAQMRDHAKIPVQTIADIGCGTGSMTFPLARRGYDVTGIDLSTEMLNVAYQKMLEEEAPLSVRLVAQDMTELDLGGTVDAVVCILDGINHLPGREMLKKCFSSVGASLASGGVFLFDLNSRHKFETVYGEEAYTFETSNSFCVWQNDYHPAGKFCDFYITLFDKTKKGLYTRSDTVQREYYFSRRTVENALQAAGMTLVSCTGGLDGHEVCDNDERWYFTAVKG